MVENDSIHPNPIIPDELTLAILESFCPTSRKVRHTMEWLLKQDEAFQDAVDKSSF